MNFRENVAAVVRMTITAVITSVVVITLLAVVYSGSSARSAAQVDAVVNTNRAVACELALPVGATGRDPILVRQCFTQYDLEPPVTLNP